MTKIQLSNFSYVDRPQKYYRGGKALRFTWAISVQLTSGERGEFAMEGCLCFHDNQKILKWSPPITHWGGGKGQQLHWINPVFYKLTLDALQESEFIKHLETPFQKLIEKAEEKKAYNTDMTLPKMLEIES
jgi:hypothetical protein